MPTLNLKPNHKVIQTYYQELAELADAGKHQEGAVAPIFANVLRYCAKQLGLQFAEQDTIQGTLSKIRPDGVLLNSDKLRLGIWEAKKSDVSLGREIELKFQAGYPKDNIIFQSPDRLIIYQGTDTPVFNEPINKSRNNLVAGLKLFFEYKNPVIKQWSEAANEFKGEIPKLGKKLLGILRDENKTNQAFKIAFDKFTQLCRTAINPNLNVAAIEEMLIQHLLTERIFITIFNNPDFVQENVIAREINLVIQALSFNKDEFIKENQLDRFYSALERAAATITDYTEKQDFLNTVYERFFQGFAVKVADTHGIVYTPQPIVDFMVKSVEEILQREFKRSLVDNDVHIIDPFVGTGNFIIRILREINALNPSQLEHKYLYELHCNEVMLLPYYIASMNIEHQFYELSKQYKPFEGICLVDTFELVEDRQHEMFVTENTQRVLKQKNTGIFVIIGNPPYNIGQQNENDNNKNRQYPKLEAMIADAYAINSKATNKNKLSDAYVKAFQWATWRLQDKQEGIVAFISNNSFLDSIAFDGMRQHLVQNFKTIYTLDLGGNVRKNPKLSGTTHNVFGIQVGVSINFLVKKPTKEATQIYYARLDEFWKKEQKYDYLNNSINITGVDWQLIEPTKNYTWLTEGLHAEFDMFISLGTKEGKAEKGESQEVIFKIYSNGVGTNRDAWACNFQKTALLENIIRFVESYNTEVDRWNNRVNKTLTLDDFVVSDEHKIKWSSRLKECLIRGQKAIFSEEKARHALYRPFCFQYLFFDDVLTHRQGQFPKIFPNIETERENLVICCSAIGNNKPFHLLMTKIIPNLHLTGDSQCFPFYTYVEDDTNRKENITDWALKHFQQHYQKDNITKWDIFYYVYGLLHHPSYREKYAANLKRELPRIPLVTDFCLLSKAGKQLADLHLHYEQQPEYPLQKVATPNIKPHYRVDKMRLTSEKTSLIYNNSLTLTGIPAETFKYRLGNRSALEWVIDQYQIKIDGHSGNRDNLEILNDYQVKTAKGSGIINNPNRLEDEQYILRLIGQVITVSLETVKIVENLSKLNIITHPETAKKIV